MNTNCVYPMLRSAILVALIAPLSLTLTGCGKVAEVSVEKMAENAIEAELGGDANVEINSEEGSFSMESSDADGSVSIQTGKSVPLPDNVPTDVPLPDGITWNMVQNTTKDTGGLILQGTVATPLDELAATLRTKVTEAGWESIQNIDQPGKMVMMTFSKGEFTLTYNLAAGDNETTVMIARG